MALETFNWQNGSLVEPAKVEVDGVVYEVTEAQFEGETPLSAANLNQMQTKLLSNVVDDLDDDTKIPSVKAVKGVYSSEEKVIGKWVNNKPLYRKVIYISSFPDGSTGNYAHNINNLDFVVSLSGVLKDNENFWTLPMTRISYTNYQVELRCNSTNIIITTNVNRSGNTGYIIMEYTKTTD